MKFNLNKSIVLVGMMGCGKSHIGKQLATDFGLKFYDSDSLIEEEQNMPIPDIFGQYGESHFRELEKNKINELLELNSCIISTGGGAVTIPETLQNIIDNSISIWLKSDIDTILYRIKDDSNRPLLNCDNPKAKLKELLTARQHLYQQANISVNNSSSPNEVIKDIRVQLSPLLRSHEIDGLSL